MKNLLKKIKNKEEEVLIVIMEVLEEKWENKSTTIHSCKIKKAAVSLKKIEQDLEGMIKEEVKEAIFAIEAIECLTLSLKELKIWL